MRFWQEGEDNLSFYKDDDTVDDYTKPHYQSSDIFPDGSSRDLIFEYFEAKDIQRYKEWCGLE